MTKAEREQAKKNAARAVKNVLGLYVSWAISNALDNTDDESRACARERARLYRIALRAVREEVRRGK